MSETTADNKTIGNIADEIISGGILSLDEATVGKHSYSLLQQFFLQDEFDLTNCQTVQGDGHVMIKGDIASLLNWENLPVEVCIFNLQNAKGGGATKHCLLRAAMPDDTTASDFFDDYRQMLNELNSIETDLLETTLDTYLTKNDFNKKLLLFSSLSYSEQPGAFYPEPFKALFSPESVLRGINFEVNVQVDTDVMNFLVNLLATELKLLPEKSHGAITEDNEKVCFLVSSSASAKVEVNNDLSLNLKSVGFAFELEQGGNPWPEIIFTGSVKLFKDELTAVFRLNLYNGQLIVQLKKLPTLRSLVSHISGFEELFPDIIKKIMEVELTELLMVIDLSPKYLSMIVLRLDYADDIALLENVITFRPGFQLKIADPLGNPLFDGMLGGEWKLGDNNFLIGLHYPSLEVTTSLKEDQFIDTGKLMESLFPEAGTFPKIDVHTLNVSGSLRTGAFFFELGATVRDKIDICGKEMAIGDAQISLTHNGTAISEATIYSEINFMGVPTQVTIEWTPKNGLELTGMTPEDEDISAVKLFNEFLEAVHLPGELDNFNVRNLQLYAAPKIRNYSFNAEANMVIMPELQDAAADKKKPSKIELSVLRKPKKEGERKLVTEGSFSTHVVLGGVSIKLELSLEYDEEGLPSKEFTGSVSGLSLSLPGLLDSLLAKIFPNYADELSDVLPAINFTDLYITYDAIGKEINLVAVVKVDGRTVKFFFYNRSEHTDTEGEKAKKRFAFGLKTDPGGLSSLPMVGESLKEAKINDLGFVYASFAADASEKDAIFQLPDIKTTAGKTAIKAGEKRKYKRGLSFTGKIKLPGEANALELELETSKKAKLAATTQAGDGATGVQVYNLTAAKTEPANKYFKVEKKIGPVEIAEIGFTYREGSLGFLIKAHIMLSGLKLSLEGLGIYFKLAELFSGDVQAAPGLDGIGILYKNSPVEVEGVFKRAVHNGHDIYNGAALIKASKFSISAIGSYANVDGQVSLFIYGLYEGAIGGPAFFFVTGIAAGFGYNRRVNIPAIDKVRIFPLVAMAMKPDPEMKLEIVLQKLIDMDAIAVSPGDYWLAAGIRFSSFKIIDSFVLLIVQFGSSTEFTLLGLSVLAWPDKKNPIAYIELALLARFGPASDVIAVQAALTPNSWILDKSCRITGGFAFYAWVSGPYEGDFVVTLGGYHPKFRKPAHYPSVDRLELIWKISDAVSIRGQMYFALTPSAIMAGGRWEVEYNLSFLRATITLWADMVISWAPYFYRIDAGIRVRIEARIKVLFVRVYFSLEMGAEVHIWGPPFAGEVYVDWCIFSFTIPFGSGERKNPAPISWKEFSDSFIPVPEPEKRLLLHNSAAQPPPEPNTLDSRITMGISRKVKTQDRETIVVNPGDLELSIDSFAPLTKVNTGTRTEKGEYAGVKEVSGSMHIQGNDDIIPVTYNAYKERNMQLGIRPMDIKALDSSLIFSLTKAGEDVTTRMMLTGTSKGVAEALWGSGLVQGAPDAKVLPDILTGMKLSPVQRAQYDIEYMTRMPDDFVSITPDKKQVPCLKNGASKPVEGDTMARIKSGIKDTAKRKTVAEELVKAGLAINAGELDMPSKTELRFRLSPHLVSLATNMSDDDQ